MNDKDRSRKEMQRRKSEKERGRKAHISTNATKATIALITQKTPNALIITFPWNRN